jgi:hypothetical protein
VQTFLPYPDVQESLACLDPKRLRNQINETTVLIKALTGQITAWRKHPAALMWEGHVGGLAAYGMANCVAVEERLNEDRNRQWLWFAKWAKGRGHLPPWVGWPEFHACHRANLKRKDPTFYSAFPEAPDNLYCWPVCVGGLWQPRFKRVGVLRYEPLCQVVDAL